MCIFTVIASWVQAKNSLPSKLQGNNACFMSVPYRMVAPDGVYWLGFDDATTTKAGCGWGNGVTAWRSILYLVVIIEAVLLFMGKMKDNPAKWFALWTGTFPRRRPY